MERRILHLHIPAFPIAVARVCHPELRERPVAVVSPYCERAVLLCVSLEARQEGIAKGMPLQQARRLCPRLTALPPDPVLLERAWGSMARLAAHYTPVWEPSRPGHIYLDLTGTERLWGRAKDTAVRLRAEVQARFSLPGKVGVAANKLVSGIAAHILLPSEKMLDVVGGREAAFMAPLDVRLIPGIGKVRRRLLLEEFGIVRVRQLAALDAGRLTLIFGRRASVIRQRALGVDPTPVYPPAVEPVVQEGIVFAPDENNDRKLLGALYRLVERAAVRLRKKALIPRRAGILVRYADDVEVRRPAPLCCASALDVELYPPLEALFFKVCTRRVRVREMTVRFRDFSLPGGQLPLFAAPSSPSRQRNQRLSRAVDQIRERFGEDAIQPGRTL